MSVSAAYLARGVLAWLPMPVIAVINAGIRELAFQPILSPAIVQPLSGLTLLGLLAIYAAFMFARVIGGGARWARWVLGLIWAGLTLAFEYALLASESGRPLARLMDTLSLSAIADGNLFALAVLLVLIAPPLFGRTTGGVT